MIPGLFLFYGGLVRKENVISVMVQILANVVIVTAIWIIAGFTLAFSDGNSFIGDLKYLFMKGFSAKAVHQGSGLPLFVFFVFQLLFAIITVSLIIGSYAERISFKAHLIFSALWSLLVYIPIAKQVWGGGFLSSLGALDFAGGLVIHISSGLSGLVDALTIGKRLKYPEAPTIPTT
jgi:Amt family ammonium transporter